MVAVGPLIHPTHESTTSSGIFKKSKSVSYKCVQPSSVWKQWSATGTMPPMSEKEFLCFEWQSFVQPSQSQIA